MVNTFKNNIYKLQVSNTKLSTSHSSLLNLIEKIEPESLADSPSKIAIEMSTFEEIATLATQFVDQDKEIESITSQLAGNLKKLLEIQNIPNALRKQVRAIKYCVKEDRKHLESNMKRISLILKEYRERCREQYCEFMKVVDLELRKMLKPLVPSNVIFENVKYPPINENMSLMSSTKNSKISSESLIETKRDTEQIEQECQPEPAEATIEKLNNHISMLVSTLEGVAKDMIQLLSETSKKYYELLNKMEVFSRPPTPLAAPLPEYFCFESEETYNETSMDKLPRHTKHKWRKRLGKLKAKEEISEEIYHQLVQRIDRAEEKDGKVGLEFLFRDTDISMDVREHIAFSLVNNCEIPIKDVSLSDLLRDESKRQQKQALKPEPPKKSKPKHRIFREKEKLIKESELDVTIDELVKPKGKITVKKSELDKETSSQRYKQPRYSVPSNKNKDVIGLAKKDVRVRSITPVSNVNERSIPARKTRTPAGRRRNIQAYNLYGAFK